MLHSQSTSIYKPRSTKKSTTEQFIKKAILIHGDKYDYSLVDYKHSQSKVIIICLIHGEFEQSPSSHLSGKGCPKCKVYEQRSSTEEFIQKAILIHGDRYDYSLVDYKNNKTKVIIICPVHGEFLQIPNNHLKGYGCQKCKDDGQRSSTEEFIKKAILIHGEGKYDYSKVYYKQSQTKVIIICPIHGEFQQEPSEHLRNKGCPICSIINMLNMNNRYNQGVYKIKNESKYTGNINSCIYRSSWELRMFLWLDRSELIKKWSSEEIIIKYISYDGAWHRYFPDLFIESINGNKYICEIKPHRKLSPPSKRSKQYLLESVDYVKNMQKFEYAKEYAKKNGMEFIILTEKILKTEYSDGKLTESLNKIFKF